MNSANPIQIPRDEIVGFLNLNSKISSYAFRNPNFNIFDFKFNEVMFEIG